MPKAFLNDRDRACHRLATWIQGEKKLKNTNDTELANEHGISQSAMSRKLRLESFDFKDFVFFAKKFEMDKDTFDYIIG
jgi:hypothetical protein